MTLKYLSKTFMLVTWIQFLSRQCVVHLPKTQLGRGLAVAAAVHVVVAASVHVAAVDAAAVAEGAADTSPAQAHRGLATVEIHRSLFWNVK